jgi:hypothetical protein
MFRRLRPKAPVGDAVKGIENYVVGQAPEGDPVATAVVDLSRQVATLAGLVARVVDVITGQEG